MTEQASLGDISEEQHKSEETEHYELGKVPEDWNVVRMADRTEIEMGSSPKSEFYNEKGEGLPFFQGNNEFGKKHPNKEVWCSEPVKTAEEGDILISVRAPVGDLNIAKEKSCIGRGLAAISNKEINREYLFYHLQERKKWLQRISAGSTYDSINSSQLKNLKLRLPEKDEQRRIASVLYNVDQAIQKTEEIIEQTQRVKKGLMQDLFTEGYYGHEEFEESRTGPIKISKPKNWELKTVSDLFKIIDGDRGKNYPGSDDLHEEGHCLFLNAGNVTSEGLKFNETEFVTEEKDEAMRKGKLDRGDLILTTRGTVGNIGFYSQDVEYDHMRINSGMVILRPEEECSRSFFYHFFNSEIFQKQIDNVSYGTAQPQISVSLAKKLEIVVPEVEEQEKIAETLDNLDEKIQREKEEKDQLQRLKKGLMQDLLTGSVRTDEDVRVLDEVVEVEG